jgi:hypothetical protein
MSLDRQDIIPLLVLAFLGLAMGWAFTHSF